MRHKKKGRKLGRTHEARMAMLKNLSVSILLYEEITTTEAKAKEVKPIVDKVISKAKNGSLHTRRQLLAFYNNNEKVVQKLFDNLAPRFESRESGYTTMFKLGPRKGDNAPMAKVKLLED